MSNEKPDWAQELPQFIGTEHYYRIAPNAVLTDGMHYLADKAGAFWLVTDVALLGLDKTGQTFDGFAVVRLGLSDKYPEDGFKLEIGDGNGRFKTLEDRSLTDFPRALMPFEFFAQWGGARLGWVMMLKSEY